MWVCKNCGEMVEDEFYKCWNCGTEDDGTVDPTFEENVVEPGRGEFFSTENMLLSNTTLAGIYSEFKILGVVCSETVIYLSWKTSEECQALIKEARHEVMGDIIKQAHLARANAIMGIKYSYELIRYDMLMVGVTGTAVAVS